ncbi:hypothetical protein KAR91_69725 [Candidatus Pacearchaeota archaeon]|nr:hypothetical protein [Candidatus Pacearchaeota archaeon]
MNEKSIKQVIESKLKKFIASVEDKEIRKLIEENTIITGGSIVSLMQNEKPSDYDMYFRNKEAALKVSKYFIDIFNKNHGTITNKIDRITRAYVVDGKDIQYHDESTIRIKDKILAELLGNDLLQYGLSEADEFTGMSRTIASLAPEGQDGRIKVYVQSDGVAGEPEPNHPVSQDIEDLDDIEYDEGEQKPFTPVYLTTNAITLSDAMQIIVRFYGEPSDVHDTFDYQHTMAYYTSWDRELIIPKEVYEAVINKQLIYTGSKYPICSLFRMRKFMDRGWRINAGQIVKMSYQISELNLNDIDVLEDQLIGVDSLYFTALIKALRDHMDRNPDFHIDRHYVISVIDKIF